MPTVRMSFAEAKAKAREEKVDWERIDAMTDEDIARQIAEDPDVAPDMSEALERGEFEVVWGIDLEHVRSKTGLDQPTFAQRFGLPWMRSLIGRPAAEYRTAPSGCISS
jgi:putative transcriptional regulator